MIGFVKWRVIETAGASSSTSNRVAPDPAADAAESTCRGESAAHVPLTSGPTTVRRTLFGAVGATVVAASGHRDTQPLQCRCKKRWAGAPLPGPYMAHTRTWSETARGRTMSPATWRRRSPTGPPGQCPSVPPSSTSPMAQRTPMVRLATAFACWLRRPLPYRNLMLMALLSTRRLNFPRHLQDSHTPVGHTPGLYVLVSVRAGRRPICGRPRPRPSTCWPLRRREEHTPLSST